MSRVVLPEWPESTVVILATADDAPSAIPLSTALRAGDDRIVFALGSGRGSLSRLRARPRVALAVLAGGDVAFTAHGDARVVANPLPGIDGVVGVELAVDEVRPHTRPAFAIDDGIAWHWVEATARDRDELVRAALASLI